MRAPWERLNVEEHIRPHGVRVSVRDDSLDKLDDVVNVLRCPRLKGGRKVPEGGHVRVELADEPLGDLRAGRPHLRGQVKVSWAGLETALLRGIVAAKGRIARRRASLARLMILSSMSVKLRQ